MSLFLRLTVPPRWDQEGNTVLTPLRIWGLIPIFTPKSKQLPCPRLLLWTHRSYADCTLHAGSAACPSSGKPRAIADHRLLQLHGFDTSCVFMKCQNCWTLRRKIEEPMTDKLNFPGQTGEFWAWGRLDPTVPVNLWHQDLCHGFGTLRDGLVLGRGPSGGKCLKVPRGAWKTFLFVCKASSS